MKLRLSPDSHRKPTQSITKSPGGATAKDFEPMFTYLRFALRCMVLLGLTTGSATGVAQSEAPATLPPLEVIRGFNDAGEEIVKRIGLVVELTETEERILACEDFSLPPGASVFRIGDEEARWEKWEEGLPLKEVSVGIPDGDWSVWRCKPQAREGMTAAVFNSQSPEAGQTLFGATIDASSNLVWQKCTVTGFLAPDSFWGSKPIVTTVQQEHSPPPMLFDSEGKLTAVLVRTNGSYANPLQQGVFSAPERKSIFGNGFLVYIPVVDRSYQFDFFRIPMSNEFRTEFHQREVQRLDQQRPVAGESYFLNWSDNHDELIGFSRKTGKTTKLKIERQDLFSWGVARDAVVVILGETVAGYSSITESWDMLSLATPPKAVNTLGDKLTLIGAAQHYEFSATAGRWISPTDTEIDAKRTLRTDAQPPESKPQIALTHPPQPNVERERAESAYHASEQSALQAARDYRAEAAQQSPDPTALAELKKQLDAAVKAAFETQMNLQQIRLQIAQRDLAEVQAKHQRRQSLADKIIERRISDLMNGEDLEWTKTKNAAAPTRSMLDRPMSPDVVATKAIHDIAPFTELKLGIVIMQPHPVDPEDGTPEPLDYDEVRGKYVNRHVAAGELITRDMLIDKLTTEQIVEFWLNEGKNGRVVFSDVYQYLTRDPKFVHTIPYDCRYSSSQFNGALPDWTGGYIQAIQQRLQESPYYEWTVEDVNLLWSISDICFYRQRNSPLDLTLIGEQLTKYVELPTNAVWADPLARDSRHSALILGEAVRLNGALPPQVLNLQPENEAVVAKLDLLKTMAENQADDRWIQQERRRLYGLLEEAPVQALKILFTAKPINGNNKLESWIFALSTEQTRDAWRSSPTEDFSPPVDPVLVVAVAEMLVGKDEVTDNNLAWVFQQQHPGYMFSRHLDDLLSSELAYRDKTLESLVTIYRFSKSAALKANIAKVAPSVPVLARKLDGDVGLLMNKNHEAVQSGNTYPLRRDAESLYRFLRDSSVTGVCVSTLSTNTCFALHPKTDRRQLARGLRTLVDRFPQACVMRHPEPCDESTPQQIMFFVSPVDADLTGAGNAIAAQMAMEAIVQASNKIEDTTAGSIPDSFADADVTASVLIGDDQGLLDFRLYIGEPNETYDFSLQTHSIPIEAGDEEKAVLATITDWLRKNPDTRLFKVEKDSRRMLYVTVPPREAWELATLVLTARVEARHADRSVPVKSVTSPAPSHYGLYFDPVDISFEDLIPQHLAGKKFRVEDLPALRQQLKTVDRCRVRLTGFATGFPKNEKTASHFALISNPDTRDSLSEPITSRISVDMAPGKTIIADDSSRVTVEGVLEINGPDSQGDLLWMYRINYAIALP